MFKINEEQVNGILAELQKLPYVQVYRVINTLTNLEKDEPVKAEKPKK